MPLTRPPVIGSENVSQGRPVAEWSLMQSPEASLEFEEVFTDHERITKFRSFLQDNDPYGADLLYKVLILKGFIVKINDRRESIPDLAKYLSKTSPKVIDTTICHLKADFSADEIVKCTEDLKRSITSRSRSVGPKTEALVAAFEQTQNEIMRYLQLRNFPRFAAHEVDQRPLDHSRFALPEIPEHRVVSGLTAANLALTERSRAGMSRDPYYNDRTIIVPPASHNDSEHTSQSSDCTSDTLSFTTEASSDNYISADPATRKRREKRARKQMIQRNPRSQKNALPDIPHQTNANNPMFDPTLVSKNQRKFHMILCEKLEDVIQKRQQDAAYDSDNDILDKHIRHQMTTPGTGTPHNGHLLTQMSNTHLPFKPHMGPLPSSSTKKLGVDDLSQDIRGKVGNWLATGLNEDHEKVKKSKSKSKPRQPHSHSFNYGTNSGHDHPNNPRLNTTHGNPQSILSVDSGLSSIRRVDQEDNDAVEMRGIKDRLIQETEGLVSTRGLYHFNGEKYKVKVPGRPPTLAAFRQKYHDANAVDTVRFFFKTEDTTWMEISNLSDPLPMIHDLVEAKVHENKTE